MALTKKEQNQIITNKTIQVASKTRTATKVIIIVLCVALLLTGGTYGVLTFINENSMLIKVDQEISGLSLSADSSFAHPLTQMNMEGPDHMDAITYQWMDIQDNILGYEGPHNGGAYFAYSFFLKNVNLTNPCLYSMAIELKKETKNVGSALRIMLIEYEENTSDVKSVKIYARAKEDGTYEYVAYDKCEIGQMGLSLNDLNTMYTFLDTNVTSPFFGEDIDENEINKGYFVMKEKEKKLSHNSYNKFTLVMWLEGTDLQCTNEILNAKCTIELSFKIEKYLDVEYYG